MLRAIAAILFVSAVGCGAEQPGEDPNDQPPTLEVLSPSRGTQTQGGQVTVTGRVTDDKKGVKVNVNGTEVTPAADGSFLATVEVAPGVSIIETHAIDSHGHDIRDARSVMTGWLVPTDGTLTSQLAAAVSPQVLTKVGNVLSTQAEAIDFNAAALAMNPVYNNTSCLGAVLDIESVALSNIDVALTPTAGTLDAHVTIDNVEIVVNAKYRVACAGGSTTIRVSTTQAHINGGLALAVSGGKLSATLPTSSVQLDGFNIDIGGIPGALESLIRGEVRKAAEKAITNVIRDKVPALANDAFANLLTAPFSADLLGTTTTVTATPGHIVVSPQGLFATVNTQVVVAGGEGGMFVQQVGAVSQSMMGTTGVGVAVANDTINQLFAGMWAAGALEQTISLEAIPALRAFLGSDAAALDIKFALPPTVSSSTGALELAIGDMMLDVKDASGNEIQKIAMSIRTSLDIAPSQAGTLKLKVGAPEIFAQVLTQAEVDFPLTDAQFEGIIGGAWGLVEGQANEALEGIALPSVMGVSLGTPTVDGRDGFLIADVPVQ
ncbi:MAG: Ig-like domain-containing protein [Kofleriaceae bacterium]|nr:Ig-like domain-containing protein [Kofleriaceae bacterium]